MAEGDNYRLAAKLVLPEHMKIVVEAMLRVVGNVFTSEDGVDRISMLEDGLREGLTSLRVTGASTRENKTSCRRTKPCCLC